MSREEELKLAIQDLGRVLLHISPPALHAACEESGVAPKQVFMLLSQHMPLAADWPTPTRGSTTTAELHAMQMLAEGEVQPPEINNAVAPQREGADPL